jgi:hypothetical protein
MPSPDGTALELFARDQGYRAKDLIIKTYPINLVCPVINPLLYREIFDKTTVLAKTLMSLTPEGIPVSGAARLYLSKVNLATLLDGGAVEGQVLTHLFINTQAENKTEDYVPSVLYFDIMEGFYIFLTENYPAGTKIQGAVTTFTLPTYR